MTKKNNTVPKIVKLSNQDLLDLKEKIRNHDIDEIEDLLIQFIDGLAWLSNKLEQKELTLKKLKKIFGITTEKVDLNSDDQEKKGMTGTPPENDDKNNSDDQNESNNNNGSSNSSKKKGHGKLGAGDYPNANIVDHPNNDLQAGDKCPACGIGTVHELPSGCIISYVGQPPVTVTKHIYPRLRCNNCLEVFTPWEIEEIRMNRYDSSCIVMTSLMKYGLGLPFYRLEKFQKMLKTPFPASTQWELTEKMMLALYSIFTLLLTLVPNSKKVSIDDTKNRILIHQRTDEFIKRKGIHTTALIFMLDDKAITLYRTGVKHAGENLATILKDRNKDLLPIIQMADALSRNLPRDIATELCYCLIHARRNFYDLVSPAKLQNPETYMEKKCRQIVLIFSRVYFFETIIKANNMDEQQRLEYHQRRSGILLKALLSWCKNVFELKKVEPNSNLGGAINYMLKHQKELTKFLTIPGVPLDNNIAERALKFIILNRKNSLFFKTEYGALVGDVILSLLKTCVDSKENPEQYFTAVINNKDAVKENPQNWLPWNFRETLATLK